MRSTHADRDVLYPNTPDRRTEDVAWIVSIFGGAPRIDHVPAELAAVEAQRLRVAAVEIDPAACAEASLCRAIKALFVVVDECSGKHTVRPECDHTLRARDRQERQRLGVPG